MEFERKYDDEERWEPVTEEVVRNVFCKYFGDVDCADMVIEDLEKGHVRRSAGAQYRRREEE